MSFSSELEKSTFFFAVLFLAIGPVLWFGVLRVIRGVGAVAMSKLTRGDETDESIMTKEIPGILHALKGLLQRFSVGKSESLRNQIEAPQKSVLATPESSVSITRRVKESMAILRAKRGRVQ